MNYYKLGCGSVPSQILPTEVSNRISDIRVGAMLWKSAENRFYNIGLDPSRVDRRDITGIRPVDRTVNMALDFVNIGMLLLGASAIRIAIS